MRHPRTFNSSVYQYTWSPVQWRQITPHATSRTVLIRAGLCGRVANKEEERASVFWNQKITERCPAGSQEYICDSKTDCNALYFTSFNTISYPNNRCVPADNQTSQLAYLPSAWRVLLNELLSILAAYFIPPPPVNPTEDCLINYLRNSARQLI
jgi:hypothetical protein